MIKSGSSWAGTFVTLDATGALATPSTGPAGVLYVDGTANGATVTISGSNPYKFAVTLPTLTAGQRVDMYVTATISTVATAGIVASAQADTVLTSDVKAETALILADTGTDGVIVGSIKADAVNAAAVKADAVTKIQNGLALAGDEMALTGSAVTAIQSGLALEATLTAIKGAGWTTETLAAIDVLIDAIKAKTDNLPANTTTTLAAIQADLDNPNQYKADVSGLATTAHVQEVENKIDAIDVTTVASMGKIDALDVKVSAIDTDSVMNAVVDGAYTFEQVVQIMAAALAGKLSRAANTLTFRDLSDTLDRIVAETDLNKQRTDMTFTV